MTAAAPRLLAPGPPRPAHRKRRTGSGTPSRPGTRPRWPRTGPQADRRAPRPTAGGRGGCTAPVQAIDRGVPILSGSAGVRWLVRRDRPAGMVPVVGTGIAVLAHACLLPVAPRRPASRAVTVRADTDTDTDSRYGRGAPRGNPRSESTGLCACVVSPGAAAGVGRVSGPPACRPGSPAARPGPPTTYGPGNGATVGAVETESGDARSEPVLLDEEFAEGLTSWAPRARVRWRCCATPRGC